MDYKLLGKKTGLFVSEVALGTAMFGTASGYGADKEESKKIFDLYSESGGNLIDTSDFYQFGESEQFLGSFLKGRRSEFVIASKYSRGNANQQSMGVMGNHRKAMREAVENSLIRLKTDYIDVYYIHFDDTVTPLEEILRGMEDLSNSGKILYFGLSNFPAWKISSLAVRSELLNKIPLASVQLEYNLLNRNAEKQLLPMSETFGLGVLAYSPLAGGLLTGKYRNLDSKESRFSTQKETGKEERLLDLLFSIAQELDATPSQIALKWMLTKNVFPIFGARKVQQLKESLKVLNYELGKNHINQLNDFTKPELMYPENINTKKMMQENIKYHLKF